MRCNLVRGDLPSGAPYTIQAQYHRVLGNFQGLWNARGSLRKRFPTPKLRRLRLEVPVTKTYGMQTKALEYIQVIKGFDRRELSGGPDQNMVQAPKPSRFSPPHLSNNSSDKTLIVTIVCKVALYTDHGSSFECFIPVRRHMVRYFEEILCGCPRRRE